MCVTNVYVDRYPDGREVEFRQTSVCQYGQPGRPCQKLSILENPIRNIKFGEPTTQYILTQPVSPQPPPHSSGGDTTSEDDRGKERIIIVDSPPTPRSPTHRSLSQTRGARVVWDSPSTSHKSFDLRAEREREERADREHHRRVLEREELEVDREELRRREQRIQAIDDEIRRRPAVPIPPAPLRQRPYLRPFIDQSEALQGMIGGLRLDDYLGERVIADDAAKRRRLAEIDRIAKRRLEEDEEEAMRQRLRERRLPRRRFSAGPGHRRHRVLYDNGYRWENGFSEPDESATRTFTPSMEDIALALPIEPSEGESKVSADAESTVATYDRGVFLPTPAQHRIEDTGPTQGKQGAEEQASNSPIEMNKDVTGTFIHKPGSTKLPGFVNISHHSPSRSSSSESLQSIVDSIFSTETFSSVSTAPGSENAFQRVLRILRADAFMKDLYKELMAKTSPEKFDRNFGTLVKRFAVDLEKEATCWNEQHAAQYIRSRARKIAQKFTQATFPSASESWRAQTNLMEHNEAESSDSSDLDGEPDGFQELEKFITNSKAFQRLRVNIQRFLGSEPDSYDAMSITSGCDLLSLLPFAEESLSEGLVSPKQNPSGFRWNLFSQDNFCQIIRGLFVSEPPIPDGMSRVRWKCACGEFLYDDYFELRIGAAKRMEKILRRAFYKKRAQNGGRIIERVANLGSTIKSSVVSVNHRIQSMNRGREAGLTTTELRYYSEDRATRTPAHTSEEVFYLLLCHNDGIGAEIVKLRQPDICDINNDNKLFQFLHEEYTLLRKRWWSWISMWTLQSIKFVRFELHENTLVDIKKLDEVPPPIKNNEYRHGPPNPPELNPPLGSTLLMHLFKHPELAGMRKHCLKKFPRKLRERLTLSDEERDSTGWGLQFIEGWSNKKLMYGAAMTFGLSSVIVMILISIMGHNIQNAAAIASFMLSFVTIGIATLQAALHMS